MGRLAGLVREHAILNLGVVRLSPALGVITF